MPTQSDMRDFSLIWSEKTMYLKTLRVLIFLACLFKVNLYKKLQMLMALIVQLNSRKCSMNAITGCVGERMLRFLKEILFFHYFYVCCSHKNGPKCFERIVNMVAIWHWELVGAAVCMCMCLSLSSSMEFGQFELWVGHKQPSGFRFSFVVTAFPTG